MMKKKWFKSSRMIALLLTISLVFLAGCQSIGGVDFNKALKNSLKVTSSESNQTLEFSLLLAEGGLESMPQEEAEIFEMLSNIKVELTNMKMQDSSHISLDGRLSFGNEESVEFALKASDTTLLIELEGAKQPFVLDLTAGAYLNMYGMEEALYGVDELSGPVAVYENELEAPVMDEEALTELGVQMIDIIGDYAIDNLPNPDYISVLPTTLKINDEWTPLLRVQTEMNGQDLWNWVKKYVDALAKDEQGLKDMIAGVIEVLSSNDALWEAVGTGNPFVDQSLDAPTPEEAAEEAATAITELLVELQTSITALEEEDSEMLDFILNDSLTLKSDLYVDYFMNIHKQDVEFSYTISEELEEQLMLYPFQGISLKSSTEQWNVNGPVTAEAPDVPESAIAFEDLSYMEDYEALNLFEEDSWIYDLMKKAGLGTQVYTAYNDDFYNPPIVVPGDITIVAVRDVVETFGGEVYYDPETQAVELYDPATDTSIFIEKGSDVAVVNGEEVQWPFPVTKIDGTTYVPADALADALGAVTEWTTLYEFDDEVWKMLTIERQL